VKVLRYWDEESANNVRLLAQDMKGEADEMHLYLIRLLENMESPSVETLEELKQFVMSVESCCDDILSEVANDAEYE